MKSGDKKDIKATFEDDFEIVPQESRSRIILKFMKFAKRNNLN